MKRIVSFLLAVFMTIGGNCIAFAEGYSMGSIESGSCQYVSPWYVEEETENVVEENFPVFYSSGASEYVSDKSAIAAQIREEMVARKTSGTFYYAAESAPVDAIIKEAEEKKGSELTADEIKGYLKTYLSDEIAEIMNLIFIETGNPVEGDYLHKHVGRISLRFSYSTNSSNGYYRVNISFDERAGKGMIYYSTAEQEAEVTAKIEEIRKGFAFTEDTSDYEKIKTIYDFVTANTRYDWTNLNNESNTIKYSAYGALINKTSVCQGYAALIYRLLMEEGISVRIITGWGDGKAHAWNIVKIGDLYYNLDATWDEGRSEYSYFLRCDKNFGDHTRVSDSGIDMDFASEAFYAKYPMSMADYIPEETKPDDGNEPGGNEPGGNEPGGNEPGGNEPGGNEPGGNEPGGNKPAGGNGDGNGDGKVSMSDLLLLRKQLAGFGTDIDIEAVDVNGDGKASMADLLIIRKHLAGIDVGLG